MSSPATPISVNAAMVARFAAHGLLAGVHDVAPPPGAGRARLVAPRLLRAARAGGGLIAARRRGADRLYMPPDAAGGLPLNVALMLLARMLGYRLWFHHHNSSYIDAHDRWMARLIAWSPRGATHVTLCEGMAERLARRYAEAWARRGTRAVTLNNSFLVEPPATPRNVGKRLRIGHLANLTVEKGALRFIALFRRLAADGVAVEAMIAGPTRDPAIARAIAEAAAAWPDRFRCMCPVHGAEKAAFYAGIDVFVFPTRYVNEAQPIVLMEALAAGVAVLATDRGCIAHDHAASPGAVLGDAAFDAGAAAWIAEHARDAAARAALPAAARAAHARLRAGADAGLGAVVAGLAG